MQGFAVVAIAAISLAAAAPCRAQGTSGTLPDPITTHELKGYADRLKLSQSQRQAANMLHDQYKAEFRSLRQGEIAKFLKDMRSTQTGMVMPSRQVVEEILKNMERLTGKIASLDNRFFDQMQTILTDDQLAMMQRVRMARQRARQSSSQMMMMGGGRPVDLSEILLTLDLTQEQARNIDPIMSQYEHKLTTSIGKLHEGFTNMMLGMYDAMEKMGFTEKSMADPETAQKMGEAMQQIWRDMTAGVIELAADLGELNQRTFKSVAPLLSPDTARTFRDRYYTQAYPEAGFTFGNESPFFDAAMKLNELTDEQRQSITATRDELQRNMDRLIEDVVSLIQKSRSLFTPFDFNSEKMQEYQKKIQEFQSKPNETRQTAVTQVNALIGPDLAKQIAGKIAAGENGVAGGSAAVQAAVAKAREAQVAAEAASADSSGGDQELAPGEFAGDQFVPGSITRRDLTDYAAILKLGDEQKAVLSQLHATYLEKVKAVQENEMAALTKATQSMWNFDAASQTSSGPTAETLERVNTRRRAVIKAMHDIDTAFLDDVELAVLHDGQAERMPRIRQMRERAGYTRSADMMGSWFGGSNDFTIDLSRFIRRQRLNEADLLALDPELVTYEKAATGAFRARFEVMMEMQHAQELWQAESVSARSSGESNAMKLASRYQELMRDVSKRMNEANIAISKLNRESLSAMLAALPADGARAVRSAYNRRAFPNVYNDRLSVDQHLSAALKLEDLDAEPRRRLSDLIAEYRPAYDRLCEQMVQISASMQLPSYVTGYEPDDWKQWQERQEALANMKFDRNELDLRTINQIRTLLTEDQVRRIGGLPEPGKGDEFDMW